MGPLQGYRVIELAGIGPAPMGGMILADMGAEVIRIERPGADNPARSADVSFRGKKSVVLNLKTEDGIDALLRMVEGAHVLIDPYRPGVCEHLGIGPEVCLERNPKLIFARMTGWGQEGPLARAAGHDINYIAITGALHAIGPREGRPTPPLNLVGDMGGGGMLLVNGILAALLECRGSGKGQVVDAAMVDGAAQLMWMFHGLHALGEHDVSRRESNMLDGGAHFYNTYECEDGKYICVGAIEPQFYALLRERAGLHDEIFDAQFDRDRWPELSARLAEVFKTRTQAEWCGLLEGTDACFAPVLDLAEAPEYPANASREVYIEVDGLTQPAPAPRFSRTPGSVRHGRRRLGEDTESTLAALGFAEQEIAALRESGVIPDTDTA